MLTALRYELGRDMWIRPRKPRVLPRTAHDGEHQSAPEVLFDFVFERGLLSIAIENTGSRPAFDVRFEFSRPFRGLGGGVAFTELRLFQGIPSLPAGKRIEALLDRSDAYFGRGEPTELCVQAFYRNERGRRHTSSWRHDLAIYRDLAYVINQSGSDVRPDYATEETSHAGATRRSLL